MLGRSSTIAGICGALALACALDAHAAKGIRTDAGNSWRPCSSEQASCSSLPDDLLLNPLGANPLAVGDLSSLRTGPRFEEDSEDYDGTANLNGSIQSGTGSTVPAVSFAWSNPDWTELDDEGNPKTLNPSDYYYAQILYFDLGAAPGQTISYYDDSGTLLTGLANQAGTWELAFNYAFEKFPESFGLGGVDPNAPFASLMWGSDLYTASLSVLQNTQLASSFVYYDGLLHAPVGWIKSGGESTSVPEPNTLVLLIAGLAGIGATQMLRRRQRPSHLPAAA